MLCRFKIFDKEIQTCHVTATAVPSRNECKVDSYCAGPISVLICAFIMVRRKVRDGGGATLLGQATIGMHPVNRGVGDNEVGATIGKGEVWILCRFEVFGKEISTKVASLSVWAVTYFFTGV